MYTNFVIFSTVLYSTRQMAKNPRWVNGSYGSMGPGSLVQWTTWVMGHKMWPIVSSEVEIEKFLVALNAAKPLGTCQKRLFFALECSKMRCRWGSAPDPAGGAYSAPPEPLAVVREGNDERRKEGEERRECKKLTLWPSMPSMKNKWPVKQKRLGTTAVENMIFRFCKPKIHILDTATLFVWLLAFEIW